MIDLIKVCDIYDFLDSFAPFSTQMDFDNCGILVGSPERKVKKVLLALDITTDVALEAKSLDIDLIISHHPIIFKPLANLEFEGATHLLSKFEINAICAHTNLDVAPKGVNFHLAQKLSLKKTEPLSYNNGNPLGLIGELSCGQDCKTFAKYVKDNLICNGVRYTETNKKIKKVAVCSGSGGELVQSAVACGADAFVTGEIKHNQILKANELGLMIVDAGHFRTENVIILPLQGELSKHFSSVEFIISESFTDKIKYL